MQMLLPLQRLGYRCVQLADPVADLGTQERQAGLWMLVGVSLPLVTCAYLSCSAK